MAKKIRLDEALDLLGIDYPAGKARFDILCPFCAGEHKGRRKTMNVNLNKGDGVYCCLRCNASGTMLKFWMEMKALPSIKDAAKDIQETLSGRGRHLYTKPRKRIVVKEKAPAPIEVRSKTYAAFLDSLALTESHYNDLICRGLTPKYIEEKMYKSIPQTSHKEIAQQLLDKGLILDGVPGFYQKNGEWRLTKSSSGILIPQRDSRGRIQGFQMRMDNTKAGKYINLTSRNYPEGTPSRTYVHMAYNTTHDIGEVVLTEGALKADVIAFLLGKSVVAVPGVNSIKYLPKALRSLKKQGLVKISIAFDMDMYTNKNVYKAYCKLRNLLREEDIHFVKWEWDTTYKGLDDYLNAKGY